METIKLSFDTLLAAALSEKVTDIHFSIEQQQMRIEMRTLNGIREVENCEPDVKLFHYLKYLAHLDLVDHVSPQTGTFRYVLNQTEHHFRFSVIHSMTMTNGVLRILYQLVIKEELSHDPMQNRLFNKVAKMQAGLIVLSGPTGSGKTSTAYTLLHKIKGRKIFSIEDPIEMPSRHIIQVQVNAQRKITYESGLKQLLRHDPDVIFIGEIRDSYEANMAIRCALTGHLVITTIHAQNAQSAIHRLADLNVNIKDFYLTAILVSNQRLFTHRNRKERVCVYELMDQNEIMHYQTSHCHSSKHEDIGQAVEKAKKKGLILKKCQP